MGGDLDHSDFVDPDYEVMRRSASPSPSAAVAASSAGGTRPPSREDIDQQVTAAQKALVELKRRQEDLERERSHLEEARRRRLEFEQGREEMLTHLTRGIGLLGEAELTARRDGEQLGKTLVDLRAALEKVSALHEESWTAEDYPTQLTRALTTLENARMEWNSAQLKWPVLTRPLPGTSGNASERPGDGPALFQGRSPAELARLGLALTWPVALAVLAVGVILAMVLARK